jgi:hypothetical protein
MKYSILILPYHESLLKFSFLPYYIKDLPLIFCFIGIFYYIIIFYSDKIYYLPHNIFNNNSYYLIIANIGYMHFILTNYIIICLLLHIIVL